MARVKNNKQASKSTIHSKNRRFARVLDLYKVEKLSELFPDGSVPNNAGDDHLQWSGDTLRELTLIAEALARRNMGADELRERLKSTFAPGVQVRHSDLKNILERIRLGIEYDRVMALRAATKKAAADAAAAAKAVAKGDATKAAFVKPAPKVVAQNQTDQTVPRRDSASGIAAILEAAGVIDPQLVAATFISATGAKPIGDKDAETPSSPPVNDAVEFALPTQNSAFAQSTQTQLTNNPSAKPNNNANHLSAMADFGSEAEQVMPGIDERQTSLAAADALSGNYDAEAGSSIVQPRSGYHSLFDEVHVQGQRKAKARALEGIMGMIDSDEEEPGTEEPEEDAEQEPEEDAEQEPEQQSRQAMLVDHDTQRTTIMKAPQQVPSLPNSVPSRYPQGFADLYPTWQPLPNEGRRNATSSSGNNSSGRVSKKRKSDVTDTSNGDSSEAPPFKRARTEESPVAPAPQSREQTYGSCLRMTLTLLGCMGNKFAEKDVDGLEKQVGLMKTIIEQVLVHAPIDDSG